GTPRLRRNPHHLRARRSLYRVEIAEVLHDRVPQPRHLLRGGDQPDSRRPGGRVPAAPDDGGWRLFGARGHQDGRHRVLHAAVTRRIPIEDSLDLHAFEPRDIKSVVEEYVNAAWERGLREVRLIHGRGRGVQRGIVQQALERHPLVVEFWDAPDTHLGATVARL